MDILSYKLGQKSSGGGGGSSRDWSEIGYEEEPPFIDRGVNYAKTIKNNWDATQTSLQRKFNNDNDIIFMPMVNTSNVTNMKYTFQNCANLKCVPSLDTQNVTSMIAMFNNCTSLEDAPIFNTSNVNDMGSMFEGCKDLKNVPIYDTSKTKYMSNTFAYNSSLSETSLDNILQMCINAITSTKTLSYIGFNSTNQTVETIQALPHYQDFLNAGWTIGY